MQRARLCRFYKGDSRLKEFHETCRRLTSARSNWLAPARNRLRFQFFASEATKGRAREITASTRGSTTNLVIIDNNAQLKIRVIRVIRGKKNMYEVTNEEWDPLGPILR